MGGEFAKSRESNAPKYPHQRFLTVTDEGTRRHLSGRDDQGRGFVMGVYPMLRDETCFFLVGNFDKATWRDDAGACLEAGGRRRRFVYRGRKRIGRTGCAHSTRALFGLPSSRSRLDPH